MSRVLVIDDDRMVRREIQKALSQADCEVIEADGPNEGIRSAQLERPDLILLDVIMPGLDGIGVLRKLRQDPKTADIPVIMVTSMGSEAQIAACLEEGAMDYITKPFSHKRLCSRVLASLTKSTFDAVSAAVTESLAQSGGRVVAFLGSKGGVGTTTVSNMARPGDPARRFLLDFIDSHLIFPDLTVTGIVASKPKPGNKITLTATVTNVGANDSRPSQTEFRLDDGTVLGLAATPPIPAGESVDVSVQWKTSGVKGERVITVTADGTSAIRESDETNNAATLTVTIKGNKVENSSFEPPHPSGSDPTDGLEFIRVFGTISGAVAAGTFSFRGAVQSSLAVRPLIGVCDSAAVISAAAPVVSGSTEVAVDNFDEARSSDDLELEFGLEASLLAESVFADGSLFDLLIPARDN